MIQSVFDNSIGDYYRKIYVIYRISTAQSVSQR